MLVNTLKSNQPLVIVLIFLTGILLWVFSFIEPIGVSIIPDLPYAPFYNLFSELIQDNSVASTLIAFFIVLLQAFLLVQFNKKYILINYRTYLPAFFYVLLASSFVQVQRMNPVLIGTIFIFIAINYLFSTYRADYALNKVFLAAFFVSIASLFWAPFLGLVLIVWISLLILRPFIGREWVVSLLGFLTPYLFVFVYYYVFTTENQQEGILNSFVENFRLSVSFESLHYSYYIFYGLLLFLILIASYTIVANYQKKKIRNRKYFEINWWLFLACIFLVVGFKVVTYEFIYLLGIPLSFLLTDYFYTVKRSWYLNSILMLFYISLIYIQIAAH